MRRLSLELLFVITISLVTGRILHDEDFDIVIRNAVVHSNQMKIKLNFLHGNLNVLVSSTYGFDPRFSCVYFFLGFYSN